MRCSRCVFALLAVSSCALLGIAAPRAAHAQTTLTISYSVGGTGNAFDGTGVNVQGTSPGDPRNPFPLTLTNGVSTGGYIGSLFTFYGPGSGATQTFSADRVMQINGISGTLRQTLSITGNYTPATLYGGATTTFDLGNGSFIDVTPSDASSAPFIATNIITRAPLSATFLLRSSPAAVPEPGVWVTALSLAGTTGIGLVRGRLRRSRQLSPAAEPPVA